MDGVVWRYGKYLDADDARQSIWLAFLKLIPDYQPKANAFVYLTYAARWELVRLRREKQKHSHVELDEALRP